MTKDEISMHAGRTTLFCAIAELSVNDLYYGLAQEREKSRHAIKKHYNLCLKEAERLKKVVAEIPEKVAGNAVRLENEEYSEAVVDYIYKDVWFFYECVKGIEVSCGDSDVKRANMLKLIREHEI